MEPTELPGYSPGAAYRVIEVLLGRVSDLGQRVDFTTQSGGFARSGSIYGLGHLFREVEFYL